MSAHEVYYSPHLACVGPEQSYDAGEPAPLFGPQMPAAVHFDAPRRGSGDGGRAYGSWGRGDRGEGVGGALRGVASKLAQYGSRGGSASAQWTDEEAQQWHADKERARRGGERRERRHALREAYMLPTELENHEVAPEPGWNPKPTSPPPEEADADLERLQHDFFARLQESMAQQAQQAQREPSPPPLASSEAAEAAKREVNELTAASGGAVGEADSIVAQWKVAVVVAVLVLVLLFAALLFYVFTL